MKVFLGERKLCRNTVRSERTMVICIPPSFKMTTGLPFGTMARVYLIDGYKLLIEPMIENMETE